MKALVIERQGGSENLAYRDWPEPETRAGDVLIRVKACGLNHLDIFVRRGMPGFPVPTPFISGAEWLVPLAFEDPNGEGCKKSPQIPCYTD